MPEPDNIDLSSLSEEADRLLTGLCDSSSTTPESRIGNDSATSSQVATQLGDSVPGESRNAGSAESDEKSLLFAAAVSELRRKGLLMFRDLPPSLEKSRVSARSFVVCDTQSKVVGRVPLALLNPKIIQSQESIATSRLPGQSDTSSLANQDISISRSSIDSAIGFIYNNLTPQERALFMSEYNANKKSVATGVVLALLLGGLGVHKFWLGSNAVGILYLAFCWTFIPGIVALIDACIMGDSVQRHNLRAANTIYKKIIMLR